MLEKFNQIKEELADIKSPNVNERTLIQLVNHCIRIIENSGKQFNPSNDLKKRIHEHERRNKKPAKRKK